MGSTARTPNWEEGLSARSSITGEQEYLTSTNGVLDVGATFSATSLAINDGTTTSRKATVLGLTDSNPLTVAITDGNGDQITSFGGGTQYIDGGVPPAHPVGNTIEWNDGSNWQTVSTAKPLPVNASSSDTTTTGTITSGASSVTLALNGQSSIGIQVSGTFSATLQVSLSVDGTSYTPTTVIVLTSGAIQNTITTATTGQINCSGMVSVKVTAISYTSGTATVTMRASASLATFMLDNSLPVGANLIGKVGIDQTTPGTTNAVVDTPVTSGGLSIVTGSVGATATAIKASAGQLYGYHLFNTTAAVAYVQIFNVAAGSVTLGSTSPTISIGIPASGGATVNFDKGIAFSTAISFACTTTRTGSSGATCDVNFFYK